MKLYRMPRRVTGSVLSRSKWDKTVNENARRADLIDHRLNPAVNLFQLGLADFGAGHDHTELIRFFQRTQIPAKAFGVVVILLRKLLKGQDQAGLLVEYDAVIDELHAQRALARAGRAFDEIGRLRDEAAIQHFIETGDACLYAFHEIILPAATC